LDLLRLGLLGSDALFSPSPGLLVLRPPRLRLIGQLLGAKSFGLLLVDELHQHALVLKHVTLALDVELVVKMTVDLLILSVLFQETTQDAHPPHPQLLDRHTRVGGTFALTGTGVTALSSCQSVLPRSGARVNSLRLLDDQAVLDQATDILSRVGVGNFIDFIWVHPDFVPPALEDGGRKPLLQSHRRHPRSSSGFNDEEKENRKYLTISNPRKYFKQIETTQL